MINYHLLVSGRVQGVGFRWATYQLALELGIYGWVQNLANGQVEIVAQGEHEAVRSFLKKIQAGPNRFARVDTIKVKQTNLEDFHDFTIKEGF
ncbi:MAG: acylphosphatase [Limosilactobacillus gorillae]|jgi:acylphosphatase|uniref:acylphosphatase n=1 Tax=Limosilactobacillus gorillae TaxID=1450649 RepID=UPI000A5F6042|nr:acylphosphatase [Limosilactobacillus gorillae]MDO4855473.1 acylphosphatase [Limosilactobacillus gorillae]